jgi:hypothetical protein
MGEQGAKLNCEVGSLAITHRTKFSINRGIIAERKHANSMLDKLMQLRKSQFAAWAAAPKELPMHGFKPPKDIDFRED